MTFKIDHIHMRCQDPEATLLFYKQMFGAEEVARFESRGMLIIRALVGGVILALSPKKAGMDISPPDGSPQCGVYELGFVVEDIHRTCTELKAKGAEFIEEPVEARPGVHLAFLKAPDNMQIEILQRD
ncbi:MAG: VOC family protein [Desulfarculaceae bacterium]|jgi:catechol 2,3-dioxygenase-like lactoylglutathione lyase family enzyme